MPIRKIIHSVKDQCDSICKRLCGSSSTETRETTAHNSSCCNDINTSVSDKSFSNKTSATGAHCGCQTFKH